MIELVKFIILGATLLTLDAIYLGLNNRFLLWQLQAVQKSPVVFRYAGAILCYPLILAGLYYFVLRFNGRNMYDKVLDAMILGFVIYGVYETTCYATFRDWTVKMLVMDTLWGSILLGSTTYIYLSLMEYLNK